MASTTSTEQSGLFPHLLPAFKKATGIEVRVVAVGTGQALDIGRRGDADVLFVHDRPAEEKFVAEGYGVQAPRVMYNDFVLVGPADDPAQRRAASDIVAALDEDRRAVRALRLARRQQRHECRRAALLEGGRRSMPPGRASPATRNAAAAWARRSTSPRPSTPTCSPTAAPGSLQEPRQARDPGRGRLAALQPVRRDGGQSGEASEHQGAGSRRSSSTGCLAARAGDDRRLQDRRRAAVLPNAAR